jgi:hypothetical protein
VPSPALGRRGRPAHIVIAQLGGQHLQASTRHLRVGGTGSGEHAKDATQPSAELASGER